MYYVMCNGLVIELHEEEEHILISDPPLINTFWTNMYVMVIT